MEAADSKKGLASGRLAQQARQENKVKKAAEAVKAAEATNEKPPFAEPAIQWKIQPDGSRGSTVAAAAKKAAEQATKAYNKTRDNFNQIEAFAAFNAAMAEMTKVVSIQHARLSELEREQVELEKRILRLEAPPPKIGPQ